MYHRLRLEQLEAPKVPEVMPWRLEVLDLQLELSEQLHHRLHRQGRPFLPSMDQTLSLEEGWADEST